MNNDIEEIDEETALNYVVNFGKYEGKSLKEIQEKQPSYLEYLRQKGDDYLQMCVNVINPLPSEEEQKEMNRLITENSNMMFEQGTDREEMIKYFKVKSDSEMTLEQLKELNDILKRRKK